jgi:transcriptional pleiotropic regulator of transition state genes
VKPAGIVRRVDPLGRIVLPKSLRRMYKMNQGDPIEILVEGDQLFLERFRPKCVFCSSIETILTYRDKPICSVCIAEMNQARR